MSDHTPGPWHYQPKESAVKAGASETVAELQFCLPLRRTTANGCLIAAAPELLDALEQALDDFGDGHCVCEATKRQVRAAIAKATG